MYFVDGNRLLQQVFARRARPSTRGRPTGSCSRSQTIDADFGGILARKSVRVGFLLPIAR